MYILWLSQYCATNSLPSVNIAEMLDMLCTLKAVQVYDWLKYNAVRLVSTSVDVVVVSMVALLVASIVPLTSLLQVMLGAGTPIAVQVNVTSPPSSTTAS